MDAQLDRIEDLTDGFRPVFGELSRKLWAMLGAADPREVTGVVTVQGANFNLGLAPAADNIGKMEALAANPDAGVRGEVERTLACLRLARSAENLRVLIAAPQAVLVFDVPRPDGGEALSG